MIYIRSPEFIHPITEGLHLWPSSHLLYLPAPGDHHLPFYSLFLCIQSLMLKIPLISEIIKCLSLSMASFT